MSAIPHPAPADRLAGNLAGAASMMVWAAGFPAADALLASWDPLAAVAGRCAVALLFLVALWAAVEGLGPRPGAPRGLPWGRGVAAGALGIGGGAITLVFAQAATDPVTVALIASSSPLAATLVERATDRRPLTPWFLGGLAATVAGGVVATVGSGVASGAGPGGGNLALGAGLAVLSCLFYSWGSQETVRGLPGRSALAQTTVAAVGALGTTLLVLLGALALGRDALPAAVSPRDLGLLALYGMGGMAASQVLFIVAVRHLGVALASFHTNATPFYVMLIMIGLGGDWSWAQAGGALIVAAGVLLAQR